MMAGHPWEGKPGMKSLLLILTALLFFAQSAGADARSNVVDRTPGPIPDQASLQTVGVPKPILDPSGVKLSVVVNAIENQPTNIGSGLPSGGRWFALNVSVTNVGTMAFDLSASDFLLFTAQAEQVSPAPYQDESLGQLADLRLEPGETASGRVLYPLAAGTMLHTVMFQAPGMAQWLITLITA
jgi:uncharacterized protein DUF4352